MSQLIFSNYQNAVENTFNSIQSFINSVKAPKHLKERWSKLNKEYKEAIISNHDIHLFRTCTGSGKTGTSVLWLKNLNKMCFDINGYVVLSSEYEHGVEEIERQMFLDGKPEEFIKFEGKNRLCTKLNEKINEQGITLEDVNKCGISTKIYCDDECSCADTCEYRYNCSILLCPEEKGGISKWISVSHEINCFLPIFLMHNNNILMVIDEDFRNAIKTHYYVSTPTLNKNIKFIKSLLKHEKNLKYDKRHEKNNDKYNNFLESLLSLSKCFRRGVFDTHNGLNYEEVFDLIEDYDLWRDPYCIERLSQDAYRSVKNGFYPFKFIFDKIDNFIDNYYYEMLINEDGDLDKWIKQAMLNIRSKFSISFLYYDKYNLNEIIKNESIKKILINDATANKNIINCLFSKNINIVEHNEDWIYEKVEFHQLKKSISNRSDNRKYAHYPKESLTYKYTFYQMVDNLREITEKHEGKKILVISREIKPEKLDFIDVSLSDYLKTISPNIIFEEYPLTGTNIYSNVNIAVLLGKPDLPRAVIEREGTLLGMNPDLYREEYSRSHMIQAIGRIMRGNEKKYVYILSGFDLKIKRHIFTYKSHSLFREGMKKDKYINLIKKYLNENVQNGITIQEFSKLVGFTYKKARIKLLNLFEKGLIKRKIKDRRTLFYYL